ncbi:hypothetical protein GCM10011594_41580 [Nakamurella endophytica]|uniref:Uncharacterized protein n=1 Tax=Nakamurella endophytica TaxID=1748367 RepID=A0A917TE25_9ACTN|nr:hypothetical protein GCM10011594_41580 [Nakamurella endophytica]
MVANVRDIRDRSRVTSPPAPNGVSANVCAAAVVTAPDEAPVVHGRDVESVGTGPNGVGVGAGAVAADTVEGIATAKPANNVAAARRDKRRDGRSEQLHSLERRKRPIRSNTPKRPAMSTTAPRSQLAHTQQVHTNGPT